MILDGEGGKYRRKLTGNGDVPRFDVVARAAGTRVMVTVSLARPARAGEALEVWTTGAAGLPLAWRATFDGARWQIAGLAHAPPELPPVEGDTNGVTIPIGRRVTPEFPRTMLTVVAVSADGVTRVATSDLKPDDARTLGVVMPPPQFDGHVE